MSSRPQPADTLLEDPCYPRLKEHVVESTGLTYYADKDVDLARRIGRRLSDLSVRDCASYFEVLRDPLRGPSELDALIAEITIGESYFFRHLEHFDALRDVVIPDLIARNRVTRRLRIWCAGCADGAEPYSLSILFKRELAPMLAGWEVSILGTDINRHYLGLARRGRFEEWSLRSTPEDLRRECFSKDGRYWTLAPEYRTGVSFNYHNLAENPFPPLLNEFCGFDLIICRNVMIYFGPELMHRTVRQFHESLVPGAWLLVGPAEPNMTHFTAFRIVNAPGVTLYQRVTPEASDLRTLALSPPPPWPLAEPEPPAANPSSEGLPPTLAEVRRYADEGAWERAARCCERLLERENLNSSVHFLHALVLQQMNRSAEAERALRRTIYLNRHSAWAQYHLGLLLRSRGDLRQAARAFENTLEFLSSRAGTETVADADGMTVTELRKLAKIHIETLSAQA